MRSPAAIQRGWPASAPKPRSATPLSDSELAAVPTTSNVASRDAIVVPKPAVAAKSAAAKPVIDPRWIPSIFAAKTTAAALLALLVAFTFNLDQPKWAMMTAFVVAQPQSGLVFAKSVYRLAGTVVGAAGALLLISLFAQERVLFLGTLALWIAVCAFGSKYARNFASYGFALSGYTVAIIGIPGALDVANAFFTAVARVTEISIGIIATATISRLVLPVSLADSLRRAVATGRSELAAYTIALLRGGDAAAIRAKLVGQAIVIENLRASAVFEDRDIRDRSDALRRLDIAALDVMDIAQVLGRSLDSLRRTDAAFLSSLEQPVTKAATAIELWRSDMLDADELRGHLVHASAKLPLARGFRRDPPIPDEDMIWRSVTLGRLRELFVAIAAFAEAYEAFRSPDPPSARRVRIPRSTDRIDAIWAGLRAATALLLVGTFWILTAWPHGTTAVILTTVLTTRLATREHAASAATTGTYAFCLTTIPAFIIAEMLLPQVSGYAMFALVVSPMLLFCAYLIANKRTAGLGFYAAIFFGSAAGFQNRMAFDPVVFLNTVIAMILAIATTAILLSVIAPDTPIAARRRFVRAARSAFERISRRTPLIGATEFQVFMTSALDQFRRRLNQDRPEDVAAVEAGIALRGAGRELIRLRDLGRSTPARTAVDAAVSRFVAGKDRRMLADARHAAQDASLLCLAELRSDVLDIGNARAAAREMVAFAAMGNELERCGELLLAEKGRGAPAHVA